jgi:hypothetical protein
MMGSDIFMLRLKIMTPGERKLIRERLDAWQVAKPVMERLRLEEYRRSNVLESILSLSDASEFALRAHPPKPTSGLIKMHEVFSKTRK